MEIVFTNKIDGIDLEKLMDLYDESNRGKFIYGRS